MYIALMLLAVYGFVLACWVTYIAVMSFKTRRDSLHWAVKANAYAVLGVGLVLDLILTVLIGSALFLAVPKELTLTGRLKRHRVEGGWRGTVATWICEKMLNPFIVGGHC